MGEAIEIRILFAGFLLAVLATVAWTYALDETDRMLLIAATGCFRRGESGAL
jgi:hypothetical protein